MISLVMLLILMQRISRVASRHRHLILQKDHTKNLNAEDVGVTKGSPASFASPALNAFGVERSRLAAVHNNDRPLECGQAEPQPCCQ